MACHVQLHAAYLRHNIQCQARCLNISPLLSLLFTSGQLVLSTAQRLSHTQIPHSRTRLVCDSLRLAMPSPHPSNESSQKLAMKGFSLSVLSKNGANTNRNGTSNAQANGKVHVTGGTSTKSSLGKRARNAFGPGNQSDDSGSEPEGALRNNGRDKYSKEGRKNGFEEVSGLEHGRVVLKGADKQAARGKGEDLVIPKMKNKDWRAEIRGRNGAPKGKNLLPPEVQAQRGAVAAGTTEAVKTEGVDVVNSQEGEIRWGLTVRKTQKENGEGSQAGIDTATEETEQSQNGTEETKPKTADEEALSALLGERKEKKGPDLVIPVAPSTTGRITEGDAYKRAVRDAPEASILEDYERIPVEEFGAALLRGMGWNGEIREGTKEVKRRQNLLGLGAKELKGAEELGAWVQKSDTKRLNTGGSSKNGGSGGERRPKASEYARERDRRREEREDRGGGSYRRERERERERGYRDGDRRR
jgi:hypothetical protein